MNSHLSFSTLFPQFLQGSAVKSLHCSLSLSLSLLVEVLLFLSIPAFHFPFFHPFFLANTFIVEIDGYQGSPSKISSRFVHDLSSTVLDGYDGSGQSDTKSWSFHLCHTDISADRCHNFFSTSFFLHGEVLLPCYLLLQSLFLFLSSLGKYCLLLLF